MLAIGAAAFRPRGEEWQRIDWPAAAFTDGTVAAIAISPAGGGKPSLVGLDLATGTVRWRTPLDGDYPSVAAAEGRLVESVPTGESWTRQDDDGSYVYSNLMDPDLIPWMGLPPTLDPFITKLQALGIAIPSRMVEEVKADAEANVGNRYVTYDASGAIIVN